MEEVVWELKEEETGILCRVAIIIIIIIVVVVVIIGKSSGSEDVGGVGRYLFMFWRSCEEGG